MNSQKKKKQKLTSHITIFDQWGSYFMVEDYIDNQINTLWHLTTNLAGHDLLLVISEKVNECTIFFITVLLLRDWKYV